jgi:hypothetical protein
MKDLEVIKTHRKISTVEAKLFEEGDEDIYGVKK